MSHGQHGTRVSENDMGDVLTVRLCASIAAKRACDGGPDAGEDYIALEYASLGSDATYR
jgi:hypothetical protein